jgi:hypothetical protein
MLINCNVLLLCASSPFYQSDSRFIHSKSINQGEFALHNNPSINQQVVGVFRGFDLRAAAYLEDAVFDLAGHCLWSSLERRFGSGRILSVRVVWNLGRDCKFSDAPNRFRV